MVAIFLSLRTSLDLNYYSQDNLSAFFLHMKSSYVSDEKLAATKMRS